MATLADIKAVLDKIEAKLAKQEKPSPKPATTKPAEKQAEKQAEKPLADFDKAFRALTRPIESVTDKVREFTKVLPDMQKTTEKVGDNLKNIFDPRGISKGIKDFAKFANEFDKLAKGVETAAEIPGSPPAKGAGATAEKAAEQTAEIAANAAKSVEDILKEFPVKGTTKTRLGPTPSRFGGVPLGGGGAGGTGGGGGGGGGIPIYGGEERFGGGEAAGVGGSFGQKYIGDILGGATKAITKVGAGLAEGVGGMVEGLEAAGGVGGLIAEGGAAAGAALASNPIGWIVAAIGAVVAFAAELAMLPFQLRDLGKSAVDAQLGFAEFSGSMAQVAAQREVFQTFQAQRMGEARAESTGRLEAAYESLSQALEPITNLLTNWFNTGLANLLEIVSLMINIWNFFNGPLLEFIDGVISKFGIITDTLEEANRLLRIARGEEVEMQGEQIRNFINNTIPMNWKRLPPMTAIPTG